MADEPIRPDPPEQRQLFTNLIASNPKKEGGAGATFLSTALHVALIALAVVLTNRVRQVVAEDEKTNILIPIPEEEEPPPPPPPPPPPNTPPPPEVVETPKGFQTLTVPTVIPPDIPPPTAGPEISERDFSGEGVEGGRASGTSTKVTAENIEAAPVFTPYTVKPELQNRDAVQRALVRNYPPLLRDAGIGGTVLLWALIDEGGVVLKTQVKEASGHEAFDEAAKKVADIMKFSPALNRDQKVKVWIQLPIVFKTQ
jgi:periplasmic protein TonB